MEFKVLDTGFEPPIKKKLLVVDDETALLTVLSDTFSDHYSIATAQNGREGVAKAEGFKPDLILMDVMMPDMNGYDAVKHLRSNALTKNIPVIMMTAKGLDSASDQILKTEPNVVAFVGKPFRVAEIRDAVLTILNKGVAGKPDEKTPRS